MLPGGGQRHVGIQAGNSLPPGPAACHRSASTADSPGVTAMASGKQAGPRARSCVGFVLAATVLASHHYESSQARFADLTAPGEVALVRLSWRRTGRFSQAARVPVERRAGAGLLQVFRRAGRVPQGRPASASGAVTAAAWVANPPRRTRRGRQVGAEVPRPVTADMSAMVAPQLMSQVSDAQAPR